MSDIFSSLGPVSSIIGAQWGDEGKGKATDLLGEQFDVIARGTGGANAGHTVIVDGVKHVFHLLPSAALHQGKEIVLGAGMVVHLPTLLEEIHLLKESGIDITPHLHLSPHAHIVLESHKERDAAREAGDKPIGTTKRGIGPTYMDKAARTGLRLECLTSDISRLEQASAEDKKELTKAADMLGNCLDDIPECLDKFLGDGRTILIEGAQGALLDVDHGTYPYVTSTATTVTGALQGLGLRPTALTSCIGVVKAYCTRVGEGPFPSEANEEDSQRLRDRGGEYGATTGRPRRCGWLHIGDLRLAALINGITSWNLTKLDVLDEEGEIPVGIETRDDGTITYERLPGWNTSTVGIKKRSDLPENAQAFISFLEDKTKIPVSMIGTGPGREEMILG